MLPKQQLVWPSLLTGGTLVQTCSFNKSAVCKGLLSANVQTNYNIHLALSAWCSLRDLINKTDNRLYIKTIKMRKLDMQFVLHTMKTKGKVLNRWAHTVACCATCRQRQVQPRACRYIHTDFIQHHPQHMASQLMTNMSDILLKVRQVKTKSDRQCKKETRKHILLLFHSSFKGEIKVAIQARLTFQSVPISSLMFYVDINQPLQWVNHLAALGLVIRK